MLKPDRTVTRSEFTAMLINALKPQENRLYSAPLTFKDKEKIGAWAMNAVATLRKRGIIEGKGGSQFAPGDQATRAEAIRILLNMLRNRQ